MVKLKQKRPQRDRAFGTIALIEASDGKLEMRCDIVEVEGASGAIMERIKAAIAGLAYEYETRSDDIDKLGGAYLNGLETGITITKQMAKTKKDDDSGPGNIGFRANLN